MKATIPHTTCLGEGKAPEGSDPMDECSDYYPQYCFHEKAKESIQPPHGNGKKLPVLSSTIFIEK
jgi:hypothetical protein